LRRVWSDSIGDTSSSRWHFKSLKCAATMGIKEAHCCSDSQDPGVQKNLFSWPICCNPPFYYFRSSSRFHSGATLPQTDLRNLSRRIHGRSYSPNFQMAIKGDGTPPSSICSQSAHSTFLKPYLTIPVIISSIGDSDERSTALEMANTEIQNCLRFPLCPRAWVRQKAKDADTIR
jgi:hypothetical protein